MNKKRDNFGQSRTVITWEYKCTRLRRGPFLLIISLDSPSAFQTLCLLLVRFCLLVYERKTGKKKKKGEEGRRRPSIRYSPQGLLSPLYECQSTWHSSYSTGDFCWIPFSLSSFTKTSWPRWPFPSLGHFHFAIHTNTSISWTRINQWPAVRNFCSSNQ